MAPREAVPVAIELGLGARIRRREVERQAGELVEPVVLRRDELDDVHVRLEHIDEGQEELPVEPILVERTRGRVGGRDHDDAALEQLLEQAPEDHRVRDVGHLQLIEAEKARLLRECPRRRTGWGPRRHSWRALPMRSCTSAMNSWKCRRSFGANRRKLEEQVRQHRLAAADGAIDIETARRRLAARGPATRASHRALRLPALQPGQQIVEAPCDIELRRICIELRPGDLRAQMRTHGPGHILSHRRKDSPPTYAHFPQIACTHASWRDRMSLNARAIPPPCGDLVLPTRRMRWKFCHVRWHIVQCKRERAFGASQKTTSLSLLAASPESRLRKSASVALERRFSS